MDIITIVPIKFVLVAGQTIIAPDIEVVPGANEARYLSHNTNNMAVHLSGENMDTSGVTVYETSEAAIAAL